MTRTVVESKTKTAIIGFDEPFCVIGERINPTGRKILSEELERGDFSRVEADAMAQMNCRCQHSGRELRCCLFQQDGRRPALC